MADTGFDWGNFIKNYGPTIAAGVGLATSKSGQKTPAQTLDNAPPEIRALLSQAISRYNAQQPMRDATQTAQYALLPSWAKSPSSSLSSTAPVSGGSGVSAVIPTAPSTAGNIGRAALSGAGAAALGSQLGMFGGPIGAGIGAGVGALVSLAHRLGGNQTNRQREAFASQFTGSKDMNQFWSYLQSRVDPQTFQTLYNTAANVIGRNDQAANTAWMQTVVNALSRGRAA